MKSYVLLLVFALLLGFSVLPQSAQGTLPAPSVRASPAPTESTEPYMEYQIYNNTVVIDPVPIPVLPNGMGDYAALYDRYELCDLVASRQIDEVWIWAGNGNGQDLGHLWEWTTSGPGWSGDAPDCGRVITTMTYNFLREVDVALESYNHRLEGFFMKYIPCDFSTATWPWNGLGVWPWCGELLSDEYGFVARPFSGNGYVGGCGDAHHPPNILDEREYVYNDFTSAETMCLDWSQDGSGAVTTLNCQAWGCTHWGYHTWWMQSIPGFNNTNRDRDGNLQPNWWSYVVGPPRYAHQVFLPVIMRDTDGQASRQQPSSPEAEKGWHEGGATVTDYWDPDLSRLRWPVEPELATLPQGAQSPSGTPVAIRFSQSRSAVTTPVVFVVALTSYGVPRAEPQVLTDELIGLLRQATIYHGYESTFMQAVWYGQDGESYAGQGCNPGTAPDNIHIQIQGMRSDANPISYRVNDYEGGGAWAWPCDPVSNWLLYVLNPSQGQADLYFKPFRDAPSGTVYSVTVQYDDGSSQGAAVQGTHVSP